MAYRQGLRRKELVNLRWLAVDLGKSIVHVVNVTEQGDLTKSRKNRSLPMHPEVLQVLSQRLSGLPKVVRQGQAVPKAAQVFTGPDGQPFRANWGMHEFARLVKRAGIAHCTLHDLRRSFSTLAQRAGADRQTVKDLGGWSVVSVVERHYTGDIIAVYRRAMDRMAETA